MNKNLVPKSILIIVLVVVAVWTLYPPNKTLKPGIDLAGGTSLIYEIDTQGLKVEEKKGLSDTHLFRHSLDTAAGRTITNQQELNIRVLLQHKGDTLDQMP